MVKHPMHYCSHPNADHVKVCVGGEAIHHFDVPLGALDRNNRPHL